MNVDAIIAEMTAFAIAETKQLIVEFEQQRFDQQGAINDHERWADNQQWPGKPGFKSVIEDKGFNKPLVDSGNLLSELTNLDNWDLTPEFTGNTLSLHIPEMEDFTDEKYDILEEDHAVGAYESLRGNDVFVKEVPGRKFKDISSADVEMITNQLIERMKQAFES